MQCAVLWHTPCLPASTYFRQPISNTLMKQLSAFALALSLTASAAMAQTMDLVLFTDDGTKFTLVIDGDVKNSAPMTRVIATGIRTETPVLMVKFEDAAIPPIKKSGYFTLGKEYTLMVTTNKKGERVLRPTGEAELGTAASSSPAKPRPSEFVEDGTGSVQSTTVTQGVAADGVQQTTSVTVIEEGQGTGTTQGVNMNVGVNGMGINMNVGVTDNMGGGTTTTHTTTTRTTTTTTRVPDEVVIAKPAPVREPYRMPGYSGPIGCAMPLSSTEFDDLKKSIESKSFEDSKMTLAKQVGSSRCFTVDQVKGLMGLFSFEDSKLDIAKYAYERTYDIDNYYKVNDAFTFETSIDDLNGYIQAR